MSDPHQLAKDELREYLQSARESLLAALDGAADDERALLGLIQGAAATEAAYLGRVFDNPFPEDLPGLSEDAEPTVDLEALSDATPAAVAAVYRRVWAHSDETADMLGLGSPGRVPWWPAARADVTLHQVLVHLVATTHHKAGQALVLTRPAEA